VTTINGTLTVSDFSVSVAPGSSVTATVNAGQAATYNLSLAPSGFAGTVALGCAWKSPQPRGTNCTLSTTSVNLNGTDPASVTVTVTTTARAIAAPQFGAHRAPLQGLGGRTGLPLLFALLLVMLLAAAAAAPCRRGAGGRTSPVRTPALQMLAATLLLALLWAACGRGGGALPPPPQTGTPAGTYTLTFTATSGNLSHSTTLTLTVN